MLDLSTKEMIAVVSEIGRPKTFFMSTFFPKVKTTLAKKVEIEFKKGKRSMAPFVAPRIGGKVIERDGYNTKEFEPPKIAPERPLTVDELENKAFGENVYSLKSADEREADILAEDLVELDNTITRREEWMCRCAMMEGKVVAKGEGFEKEIDFGFENLITLIGEALWTNENSDPIGLFEKYRRIQIKDTGHAPDIVLLGEEAGPLFEQHPKVQAYFDKKDMNMGKIEPSIISDSVTFIGKINKLGLEIYTYDEWFLDDDGTEKPMMPKDKILIGKKGIHKMVYGSVTQIEDEGSVTYEGSRVPKKIVDSKNELITTRLTAKPVPVPEDVATWHVIKVK